MEMSGASSLSEQEHSEATFWSSDITSKLHSTSLESQEENLSSCGSPYSVGHDELSSDGASQVLWATGTYSGPIPNGFYSVIPDKKLKESYDTIPSPEELCSLSIPGLREEVILVDADRDKKLSRLKQLSRALAKGQNANPASIIKKLAGLVWDFYNRPSLEPSPAKASTDDILHLSENRGFQLLGQLRHGSCRPRAILFKVLADAVGLESKLVVGLPRDGGVEYIDAYKHMSVVVVLNSVELLVDLMRYPGQLIPFSAKAIFISHISTQGESDSAENDSCDSPLEPNSPLCGLPDGEGSHEQDENHLSLYQRRAEVLSNAVSSSFRNLMGQPRNSNEGMLSLSQSEPNVANIFPRRSQRKAVIEQRTASSSPEHPFFRRNKSILGGSRQPQKEYPEGLAESRSSGASISETCRTRRRSISMTPEIGDDIVRVVKAMNEKIKQNRLLRDNEDEVSHSIIKGDNSGSGNSPKSASTFSLDSHDQICVTKSVSENQINSNLNQKATSLPSSPHNFRGETSDRSGSSSLPRTGIAFSTMNKMLQASQFLNGRSLLPFQEWNIDFSELTVGTRVGIGFFGEVFRGIWNGTDVALKVFPEQDITSENIEDFCNEISILSRLRHPNVILFLGACMRPPHLSMVTEYMEMGSLYYLIHMSGQKKKLNWRRRFRMLADICRGLMCIHRMKIIHRDLKSANCLVDRHWTVKICDFGLSRIITDGPMRDNSSAGTPEWMAPELIRNEPFTNKCDIFSFGVIVWELCTLSRPWEGIPAVQVVYAVANEGTRLEIPEGPLGKLIADCWAEPDDRPSCQEILSRLLDCEYTLC